MPRVRSGVDHGSIDLGGAKIGGMMLAEPDPLPGKCAKVRRIVLSQKIRPHPIPNYYDHMALESFEGDNRPSAAALHLIMS